MEKLLLSKVDSPQVELECGGHTEQICSRSNAAMNSNFDENFVIKRFKEVVWLMILLTALGRAISIT